MLYASIMDSDRDMILTKDDGFRYLFRNVPASTFREISEESSTERPCCLLWTIYANGAVYERQVSSCAVPDLLRLLEPYRLNEC